MEILTGKAAFISGGASGIGLGMAQVFIEAGMNVAIADLRVEALEAALESFAGSESAVHGIRLDVTDREAWVRAADEAERVFGPVQVLCNNAGVTLDGPMPQATYDDWDFCLGVNLGGVVNGVQTFVPRLIAHGQGGHIVNTASVGGLIAGAGSGIYTTSKFAVVGLTEELRSDLAPYGIGVSVLCPGPTQTDLFASSTAVRPAKLGQTGYTPPALRPEDGAPLDTASIFAMALKPVDVGHRVLAGIRRNDLYILTHSDFRGVIQSRCEALLAAMPKERLSPERVEAARRLVTDKLYAEHQSKSPP